MGFRAVLSEVMSVAATKIKMCLSELFIASPARTQPLVEGGCGGKAHPGTLHCTWSRARSHKSINVKRHLNQLKDDLVSSVIMS